MTYHVHPGPHDTSVLDLQENHVSQHIWDNLKENHVSQHIWNKKSDRILNVRRALSRKHEDPPQSILPYLEQAGFIGIAHMGYVQVDHRLITSLVERWRPETNTFHMPQGECTITLEDIAIITGLPIDGQAVTGHVGQNLMATCLDLLGVMPNISYCNGSSLSISWLAEQFAHAPHTDAPVIDVERYTRAYILQIIGDTLFTDHSGTHVHMMFLPLLSDFAITKTYSWGSAVLAFLYRELGKSTNFTANVIGGACSVLQIWAWHRFPRLVPSLTQTADEMFQGYLQDRDQFCPAGFRWHIYNNLSSSFSHSLQFYRHFFDTLKIDLIDWQPYTKLFGDIPGFCLTGQHIWRSCVPMIFYHIVEWHQPDRVMRQFGMDQPIPSIPQPPNHLRSITLVTQIDDDWKIVHKQYIHMWDARADRVITGQPLTESLTYHSEYIEWFKKITRRWISPTTAILGSVTEIVEQLCVWATDPIGTGFTMENLRQSAEQILLAMEEYNRIYLQQLKAPSVANIAPPLIDDEEQGTHRRRKTRFVASRRQFCIGTPPTSDEVQSTHHSEDTVVPLPRTQVPNTRTQVPNTHTQVPDTHTQVPNTHTQGPNTYPPPYPYYSQPPYMYPPPPPPNSYPPPPPPYSYPPPPFYFYPPPPFYYYPPPPSSYSYPPPNSGIGTSYDRLARPSQ